MLYALRRHAASSQSPVGWAYSSIVRADMRTALLNQLENPAKRSKNQNETSVPIASGTAGQADCSSAVGKPRRGALETKNGNNHISLW